jgi:hypothetical protein
VRCENKADCRKICANTIKKNRIRFADYGHKQFADFLEFTGSRYCPTRGGNLSEAEKRLNGNWVKNVKFYLQKARRK